MNQPEPINLELRPNQAMALDLTDYVDDAVVHIVFLRIKGLDMRSVQTALRAKLAELRRVAVAYLRSSEAVMDQVVSITAECRGILDQFSWHPAAQRITNSLDNVLKRLRRATTADDCNVSAGIFIVPGR